MPFRSSSSRRRSAGFTLIELLTVIAIIGILAAIIIPTTGAVRTAARKTQTRSMFKSWENAFNLFRTEYGYLPQVSTTRKLSSTGDTLQFVRTLTGREPNGSPSSASDLNGNKRRLSFLSFSDSELPSSTSLLTDAFGNTEFGVIVDADGNKIIGGPGAPAAEAAVAVRCADNNQNFTPGTNEIPAAGVRADVIFYSAGKDASAANAVLSWK